MLEITKDGQVLEICGGIRKPSVFKVADVRAAMDGRSTSVTVEKAACSCHVQKVAAGKSSNQSVPNFGQVSPERQALADAEKAFDPYSNISVDRNSSGSRKRS
jgi:hypothetical protein